MAWECPHLHKDYCRKREKDCLPGAPGCVLYGRYTFPFAGDKEGTGHESSVKKSSEKKRRNDD